MEARNFLAVHVKMGKVEVEATSSYEAAQLAADVWGLKSTAGIDTYLLDQHAVIL